MTPQVHARSTSNSLQGVLRLPSRKAPYQPVWSFLRRTLLAKRGVHTAVLTTLLGYPLFANDEPDTPLPAAQHSADAATAWHAQLDHALNEYEMSVESEVEKVLAAITKVFADATQRGDLALAKKARAAQKRLQEDGEPPSDTFVKRAREEAQRNINRAARKLETRYGEIAKTVLKQSGDLDAAEAIVTEATNIVSRSQIWKKSTQVADARKPLPRRGAPFKVEESTVGGTLQIKMVSVGDPGNAPDANGFGGVAYEYRIGKYEITIEQYCAFLNKVAQSDPHELFDQRMTVDASGPSIIRNGTDGSFRYAVMMLSPDNQGELARLAMSPLRPISWIRWVDAARFCNWLHNGQGAAGTETGAYDLNSHSTDRVPRQPGARFFIPSEDEWYKAAYYGGSHGDGKEHRYFQYATQHDEAPVVWQGIFWQPGKPMQLEVFYLLQKGDNIANWNGSGGSFQTLAPVNHFPMAVSRYGCNVMTGNLEEHVDAAEAQHVAVRRGGFWWAGSPHPSKEYRATAHARNRSASFGFRIAASVE
jgi:sulfatase modifying factor 1